MSRPNGRDTLKSSRVAVTPKSRRVSAIGVKVLPVAPRSVVADSTSEPVSTLPDTPGPVPFRRRNSAVRLKKPLTTFTGNKHYSVAKNVYILGINPESYNML